MCSLPSGTYSSPFLWKIPLSCSHAAQKCSASWHPQESPGCWGNRQRNPSRNTLSLLGFSASAPLTQEIWQGKQTGRWHMSQNERLGKSTDRNKEAAGRRPKAQSKFYFFVSVIFDCKVCNLAVSLHSFCFMKSNVLLDFFSWPIFIYTLFDLRDKTSICIIMSLSATVNMYKLHICRNLQHCQF